MIIKDNKTKIQRYIEFNCTSPNKTVKREERERERERRIRQIYIINIALGGDFENCMHARMECYFGWGKGRRRRMISRFFGQQRFNPFKHTVALFKVRMLFARTR